MPDIFGTNDSCLDFCGVSRFKCGNRYCSRNPRYYGNKQRKPKAQQQVIEIGTVIKKEDYYGGK